MREAPSSRESSDASAGSFWPLAVWAALLALTIAWMVRGGLSVDLRGLSPDDAQAASQLVTARLVGVVEIVLTSMASLGAMAAGGLGLAAVVRRWADERIDWLTAFTLGLGLLWLGMFITSTAMLASGATAWGWCLLGALAGVIVERKALTRHFREGQSIDLRRLLAMPWAMTLTAPPVALLVVAACCPPGTLWAVEAWGYDVLSYHLQLPREWMQAGRLIGLEHNVYGQLPSLVETAFLQLGLMRGGMYHAVYTCQLLSVALAMLAAANLASLVRRLSPTVWASHAGWFAAAIFLATPWVLVTGSMAYDEMAVLAMGAAGLAITLATPPGQATVKLAVLAGVLAGLATLAKLTGGLMIALPIGLLWVGRGCIGQGKVNVAAGVKLVAGVTLAGMVTLSPYLIRNTAWTGNPVFPFAAKALGQGHWNDELVDRWNRGHHVSESFPERLTALGQHWLCNTGYGALGGRVRSSNPDHVEARNVAYFPRQWGFPTLILAGLAGMVLLVGLEERRGLGLALIAVLVVQIAAWLFATHLQSRFMAFSLLPLVIAAGVGWAEAASRWARRLTALPWAAVVLLTGLLTLTSAGLMRQQAIGQVPLWQVMDSLPPLGIALDPQQPMASVGDHPVNKLPSWTRTLMVADNSRLFYIHRPMAYHSAFDASLLGELMRQHPGDAQAVTEALKARGITHVWIHLGELTRLMNTYGFDPAVTPPSLHELAMTGGWRRLPYDSDAIWFLELP